MKIFLFLSIITLPILSFGQKLKDSTYVGPYADCTEFYKNDSILLEKLKIEKSLINYSILNKIIFKKINKQYLKSENLIVFIETNLKRHAILPDDFYWCQSKINIKNPNYNETDFWRSENLQKLNTYRKNIIPKEIEIFTNKENFINDGTKIKNSELYSFIISKNNFAYFKNQKLYYLPINGHNLNDLQEYDSIRIEFTNLLERQVEAKIIYKSSADYKVKEEIFTFQFENKKWKLINQIMNVT